ncbi:hypothetical protein [Nocardia sp. NPDC051570]|uniref:phthiocerol/phthiodiolone dimycocerosyl transferase family protein n=1 Tax=Nocardia sp. NPDC051570 TaxID=3364324 RepID=UPI0037A14657
MKYKIGAIDHYWALTRATICYALVCSGPVDVEILRQAFDLLCRKYPMLGGHLELVDGECHLRLPDTAHPTAAVTVVDGPIPAWLEHGIAPMDPTRALARLEVVQDGHNTAIGLQVSHAVADGRLGFQMLRDLCRFFAFGADMAPPDTAPVYPRGIEDVCAARDFDIPQLELRNPGGLFTVPAVVESEGLGFRVAPTARIRKSVEATDRLVRYARVQGTTLHALVSAAIIRAERAMVSLAGEAEGEELPMLKMHVIDLRAHLQPPAELGEVTNALGLGPTAVMCAPDTDMVGLGKEIKQQLIDRIESGQGLAIMLDQAQESVRGEELVEPSSGFISNLGVIAPFAHPAGIEYLDFRGLVILDPQVRDPNVCYFVFSFGGRLLIEIACAARNHSPDQIARLSREISDNLDDLALALEDTQ